MPGYLLKLSRKLLGARLKTIWIMLQFLLLFSVFNVLAYDLWDETSRHRQMMTVLERDTFVLDAALQNMAALNGPDMPPSWLPDQVEYIRESFGERFSFYYENFLLSGENKNGVDVLHMEDELYRRVTEIYFGGRELPYFHGRASGSMATYSLHGEIITPRSDYELKKTDLIRYLTLRDDRPFLVLPAEEEIIFTGNHVNWQPLYEGPLTNEERARIADELGRLNPDYAYSFRLLSEFPVEQHQYEIGKGVLHLVFIAAAALMLFTGYIGSSLTIYAVNRRSLQTLRLFGAGMRHMCAIAVAWNAFLLLPGFAAALLISYGYIRKTYGGEFFISFLPFPLLLCGLLVLLGCLPIMREYWKDRHVTLKGEEL